MVRKKKKIDTKYLKLISCLQTSFLFLGQIYIYWKVLDSQDWVELIIKNPIEFYFADLEN